MDLSQLLNNGLRAQMAGAGGYSKPGFMDHVGDIATVLGSMRQSGLAGGLAALNNRQNIREYNSAINKQAQVTQQMKLAEMQRKIENEQGARLDRQGLGRQFGLEGYAGYEDLPDAPTLKFGAELKGQQDINNVLGGGALHISPKSYVQPELLKRYLERQSTVADSEATLDRINRPRFMSDLVPTGQPQMQADPSVVQGGIAQSDLFGQSPFGIPAVDVDDVNTRITGDQTYTLGNRKAGETERSNKADEKIDRYNAESGRIKANKYQPSGGGTGAPKIVKDEIAANNTAIKQIDSDLKQTFGTKDGKLKAPKDTGKPGYVAYQEMIQRKQELQSRNKTLQRSVFQGSGEAGAFGGQSQAKLSAAQQSLVKKYGGK